MKRLPVRAAIAIGNIVDQASRRLLRALLSMQESNSYSDRLTGNLPCNSRSRTYPRDASLVQPVREPWLRVNLHRACRIELATSMYRIHRGQGAFSEIECRGGEVNTGGSRPRAKRALSLSLSLPSSCHPRLLCPRPGRLLPSRHANGRSYI